MGEAISAAFHKLFELVRPEQACWLCILLTLGGGFWGVNTFARADDVELMRIEQLEKAAFDYRGQQCKAIREGQPPDAYTAMLQQTLRRYEEVTGKEFRLPDCTELKAS